MKVEEGHHDERWRMEHRRLAFLDLLHRKDEPRLANRISLCAINIDLSDYLPKPILKQHVRRQEDSGGRCQGHPAKKCVSRQTERSR